MAVQSGWETWTRKNSSRSVVQISLKVTGEILEVN
jgi:hypothetical protein